MYESSGNSSKQISPQIYQKGVFLLTPNSRKIFIAYANKTYNSISTTYINNYSLKTLKYSKILNIKKT